MLARLLAVGDDVDAGVLLIFSASSVASRLPSASCLAVEPPRRPQPSGSASQEGFGRLPAIVVSSTLSPCSDVLSA